MPRPRRTNQRKGSALNQTADTSSASTSTASTRNNSRVLNRHMQIEIMKAEVRDKMKDAREKLELMRKQKLEFFDLEYKNSLMSLSENDLNEVIDIDSDMFRSYILSEGESNPQVKNERSIRSTTPKRPTARRRSRSVTSIKIATRASNRLQHIRSTSVDVYKTPQGRIRLSSIMTQKKYTVSKPKKAENSGVHLRRIMKPDEEAISTCGSPLYVAAPSTLGGPHANIPLPGGVVLNIEPKYPKGPLEIPDLDLKTKSQIKLLCEQLQKLV